MVRSFLIAPAAVAVGMASSIAQPADTVRIVTVRGTPATSGFEQTDYIRPDRRRQEHPGFGGEPLATIARCDLDSYSWLDLTARTYVTSRLSARTSGRLPPPAGVKRPLLHVEITTVDTRERRTIFGYTARRMITTQKETSADSKPSVPTEVLRKDGWYIDLNTRISCGEDAFIGESNDDDVAMSGHALIGNIFEPVFRYIGKRETGYPLEEHRTYRHLVTDADGASREVVSSWSIRVTSLSHDPFDPTRFEIPREFRMRPTTFPATPTFAMRLMYAWHGIKHLARQALQ